MAEETTAEKALPAGSTLVKVGDTYRVMWNLGGGLGWAWYTINDDHLKKLYGNKAPEAAHVYTNQDAWKTAYGNSYFWGNIAETSLTAETPWQDMKDRVFNAFGYLPGLEENEIQRLLLQAFFEGWGAQEFQAQYATTDYYNKLTNVGREWLTLSDAEKASRIDETTAALSMSYERIYGQGFRVPENALRSDAKKIATGELTMAEWEWTTRQAAEKVEGTGAYNEKIESEKEKGQVEVDRENLAGQIEDMWRMWVGSDPREAWVTNWTNRIFMNKSSLESLEDTLTQISAGRWQYKPPNITYADWAEGYKATIADQLEMFEIDDKDPLLRRVLSKGLAGDDLVTTVRKDARFQETQAYRDEMFSSVESLGKTFGFI